VIIKQATEQLEVGSLQGSWIQPN